MRNDGLVCGECKTRFPTFRNGGARIPWLFRDPEGAHLEWRARLNGFLHANSAEQARLKDALNDATRSRAATERLTQLLNAREAQRKQIVELLGPLHLGGPRTDSHLDRSGLLHSRLPKQQELLSYYTNIFRDWSWDNGENEKLFECVGRTLQTQPGFKAGRMLTLGAGACRLSYDLHRHYQAELTVALDLNPLLLFLGSRVIQGDAVTLHEVPIAPLRKSSVAVARTCVAPEPISGAAFAFVLADAMASPFKPGSFDTVLTPWLIDVVPQDFTECVRVVNRVLKAGGIWLNTGSLSFSHRNEAWCYSEEEVLKLVGTQGFEVISTERVRIPYLQSPASARGGVEHTFNFSARKTADTESPKRPQYLPRWLSEPQRVIPDLDEFVVAAGTYFLKAHILAAIDGKRTVDEIAALVARHYGLQKIEAKGAVLRLLLELYGSNSLPKANSPPDSAS